MTMDSVQFRRLRDDEVAAGHRILREATAWLLSRNIRQWSAPPPREEYEAHQRDGWNYALLCDGRLAVILSLIRSVHPYWRDELGCVEKTWLTKLATSPAFRGRGLGRRAVVAAIAHLAEQGAEELYLDCVYGTGFLSAWYDSLGFEQIARKIISYPKGDYDMVLMRKTV